MRVNSVSCRGLSFGFRGERAVQSGHRAIEVYQDNRCFIAGEIKCGLGAHQNRFASRQDCQPRPIAPAVPLSGNSAGTYRDRWQTAEALEQESDVDLLRI